jgi:hypothetical protein
VTSPKTPAATRSAPASRHKAAGMPGPLLAPHAGPGAPSVQGSPTRGTEGAQASRTWVLEFEPGMEILPSNTRLSRYPKARVVRALREQGWGAAKKARLPRLECADIHVTYVPPPRRKKDRHPLASARVEDSGALTLTAKALIDGIRDAGVFADDNRKHVRRESYEVLGWSCPRGQVVVRITEVAL